MTSPLPAYLPSAPVNWSWAGLAAGGIDYALLESGGPDCTAVLSTAHRLLESALAISFFALEAALSWRRLSWPRGRYATHYPSRPHSRAFRTLLCAGLAFIFGVEVGYKFCTQSAVFLLYPCHILTMLQIILLAIPNDNWIACFLFRICLYSINGPITALVFPVLNTLFMPLEVEWYYVQHVAILLIPLYLLSLGGAYTVEPLGEPYWACLATALNMLYHLVPMQLLAHATGINLSMVLCPAPADPVGVPWWRTASFFHQHLTIPASGKLAALLAITALRFLPSWLRGDELEQQSNHSKRE